MDAHPAAALFPMLDHAALSALAEDIKDNGQTHPIIVWRGVILDGRNRMAACGIAGRDPVTKDMSELSERDAVRLVISVNVHRRHLSESQRAMITAELAKLEAHRPVGGTASNEALTQSEAAEAMQVSRSSVQRARKVKDEAPDLADRVIKGEITVSKAAQMARKRKPMATNPDLADDSVVDATETRHAEGDTAKARAVLAAVSRLDPTELSYIKPDLLRILGVKP
jgi:ParB-like chromosome segregation protein Spo0J